MYREKKDEKPLSDCLTLFSTSKEGSLTSTEKKLKSHGDSLLLSKESSLKGASSTRMLAKIREKAKTMKDKYFHSSRKKAVKLPQEASDHRIAPIPPAIVKQSSIKQGKKLTDGICVSSCNIVKSFSKYPDSIPTSTQIAASKQYQIFYEWKDVHPFMSVSRAIMFGV